MFRVSYLLKPAYTLPMVASLGYASQNLLQALTQIDNRLKGIEQGMRMNVAQKCNMRIVNQNRRLQLPDQFRALQKTVSATVAPSPYIITLCSQNPGYGRDKALPLTNVLDAAGRHAQFPPNGVASATGSIPPQFDPRVEAYGHLDILKMIVFYDDNFGIVAQDDLVERMLKFRAFLADF